MEREGNSMGATMSKRQHREGTNGPPPRTNQRPDDYQTSPPPPRPGLEPRRYAPPQCSACTAIRPAGKDYTSVYAVKRDTEFTIRYCKCGYCNNTFKDMQRN